MVFVINVISEDEYLSEAKRIMNKDSKTEQMTSCQRCSKAMRMLGLIMESVRIDWESVLMIKQKWKRFQLT